MFQTQATSIQSASLHGIIAVLHIKLHYFLPTVAVGIGDSTATIL